MTAKLAQQVVTVGRYALATPWSEYVAATQALTRRAEQDGDPGLLAYQFYGEEKAGTAANVMVYADAGAWIRHHEMMSEWEERTPFGRTVRFVEYRVHGPLSPEVRSSLAGTGIPYGYFPDFAAGFAR